MMKETKAHEKKSLLLILIVLALATLLVGCPSNNESGGTSVPTVTKPSETPFQVILDVSVSQAFQLIQENKDKTDFIIIDVRTAEEHMEGYIEGSVLIDFRDSKFEIEINKLDKEATYLVYCRSGNRSSQATNVMKDLGFQTVYNMTGGFGEWQSAGYPVTV
jgi:rhodanese-related sulfurtransferase